MQPINNNPVQNQINPPLNAYQQPMVGPTTIPMTHYQPQPQFQLQYNQPITILKPTDANALIKKSGLQKLDEQLVILIKQKIELMEVVTGCETENKYNVYALDKDGITKRKQLFKCKEKSGFCSRQCLSGDCRPFKMTISTLIRGEEDDEYEPFLQLERPCKFTCFCLQRPELLVTLVEGGRNEYLGKIVDPFNWCNMQVNIFDKNNSQKYMIEGSCCQLGVWCRMPCEPCQTIDFGMKSPSGELVSGLQKRTAGCLKSMVSDADSFALNFPSDATGADKALLMCAALLIDFRHFERRPNRNKWFD